MFVNKTSLHISHVYISESKKCCNAILSVYYFYVKTKMSADFQICIVYLSVYLKCVLLKLKFATNIIA